MNTIQNQTFQLEDEFLHVYIKEDKYFFRAIEVGQFLGIKNIYEKLSTIKEEWKVLSLTEVSTKSGQKQLFINEPALYEVILTMRLSTDLENEKHKRVRIFKDWIFEIVIPSLRKGVLPLEKTLTFEERERDMRLKTYEIVHKVFTSLGMDERDKLMFQDYGRTLMLTNSSENLQECSVSKRLNDKFGVSLGLKHLTQLGKKIASEYRRINSMEPIKREQFVDGTIRCVNSYNISHFETFIDKILETYLKTLNVNRNLYLKNKENKENKEVEEEV